MRLWPSIPVKKLSAREEREMEYINADLLRKVVYFEWILIVMCSLGEYTALTYEPPLRAEYRAENPQDFAQQNRRLDGFQITGNKTENASAQTNMELQRRFNEEQRRRSNQVTPWASWTTSIIFLFIVFLLSFFNPTRSSYWDRMCFLLLEIVFITGGAVTGWYAFVLPIYMVSVAKACLILDRSGQWMIFIAALITQFGKSCFQLYTTYEWIQKDPFSFGSLLTMVMFAIVDNYGAIAMMVLVGIVTLTLVSEQKARLEAERLSNEVENLATELERTRIAQEIHDSLGHTLTSLNIQLEVARKFADRDQKRAADALEIAKQLAGQSLTDVRTAIQSIRHPDFDLKEAVNSLAKQIRQSQALEVNVEIDASEISTPVAYQLFRIIQECLTNVMKHAEASTVKVLLTQDGKKIELRVSDNGKGLASAGKSQGFGIRGMQERVESMHGTVEIQSQPGEGTSLQVIIPT